MAAISSLDELVEEKTATFGFAVNNDCGFGAGASPKAAASALFTFDLPRVPAADAKCTLDYLQDLAAGGQSIKLDLPASLSCLVVRYLKKKAVSRQDIAPADWPKFVRACDYLGLPELPAAATNDAAIAFVSASTSGSRPSRTSPGSFATRKPAIAISWTPRPTSSPAVTAMVDLLS